MKEDSFTAHTRCIYVESFPAFNHLPFLPLVVVGVIRSLANELTLMQWCAHTISLKITVYRCGPRKGV